VLERQLALDLMDAPQLPVIQPASPGAPVAAAQFNAQVSGLVAFQLGGPLAVLRTLTKQAIPNNTWTAVAWDTVDVDTHAGWAAANPTRYTASVPGWFEVDARADLAASTAAFRSLLFQINGVNDASSRMAKVQVPPVGGVDTSLTTSTCLYLNTGDYLEALVFQFSGAAITLDTADGVTLLTIRWCHQ
jgi:hypothetical protein